GGVERGGPPGGWGLWGRRAIDTPPDAGCTGGGERKKGAPRRGPRSLSTIAVSAMPVSPPMPEPIITPVLIWSSYDAGFQPASSSAWCAAAMAKTMKSSTLRCSFGSIHWSGLKVPSEPSPRATWQAILLAGSETSTLPMRRAPLLPSMRRRQVAPPPQASGPTIPTPVTTTPLIINSLPRRQYHIPPAPQVSQACSRPAIGEDRADPRR